MEQQNQQQQPPVFKQPQFQPRVTASPMMNPIEAVVSCFKKYFDFKGRARRSEFWWFILFVLVINWVLSFLSLWVPALGYVSMAVWLAVLIPHFAVLTRRVHDSGHSGWWIAATAMFMLCYYGILFYLIGGNFAAFNNPGDMMEMSETLTQTVANTPGVAMAMVAIALITLVLFLITLVFALQDSQWQTNKYGPSPKYQ